MVKGEFERELEQYLHARKSSSWNIKRWFSSLVPKAKPRETIELPQEVEVYEEPEKEEKKQTFLERILPSRKEETTLAQMQAESAVQDMKEVAKITLGMIKQLPDEQLKTFKQSQEFEKLKHILRKHELIR
ncbi:hypothetical protein HY489_02520 [Candidatus Woesearchaeota archaeon]|nr:hypothetical protein [Candidatus Woesearchaeota archaeon]